MDYEKIIKHLMAIAIEAGKSILQIYNQETISIEIKSDSSPLTDADFKSHCVIVDGLQRINKLFELDIPIVSEENLYPDYAIRKEWNLYWLIDPLDGTKEFIKRNGEFTVNVALVEQQTPILGVVYLPVADVLYSGNLKSSSSAYRFDDISQSPKTKVKKIPIEKGENKEIVIIASRSHVNEETNNAIQLVKKKYKSYRVMNSGSSLKFCKVAEGSADFYPRFAPTMEWDTAAADAICRSAGCFVLDAENHLPLKYNKESLLNPFFYVTSNKVIRNLLETVK